MSTRSFAATFIGAVLLVGMAAGCGGGGASGDFECRGNACVCPGNGDCRIDCLGDCDLQCAGSGLCDFSCGDGCLTRCTGSGDCFVSVGEQSSAACTGSGGCDVTCNGDCLVACPGSGACRLACAPGATCDFSSCSGSVRSCANGTVVCGGQC